MNEDTRTGPDRAATSSFVGDAIGKMRKRLI